MDGEFKSIVAMVRAGEEYLDALRGQVDQATKKVEVLREAMDVGLIKWPIGKIESYEMWYVAAKDAIHCADESIAEARKRMAMALRAQTESLAAKKMGYSTELRGAQSDYLEWLGQARSRSEEIRRFGEIAIDYMRKLELPTFTEEKASP